MVLRFNDIDVKRDTNNVLTAIEGWIVQNNPPAPFTKYNPLSPFIKGELANDETLHKSMSVHKEKFE
jgi:hypothetical protein